MAIPVSATCSTMMDGRSAFCCCSTRRGATAGRRYPVQSVELVRRSGVSSYAPLLTKIAQHHKEVTYLNISPATWTWPIIEAQGFVSYCSGLFFSIPALSRVTPGMTSRPSRRLPAPSKAFPIPRSNC